MKRFNKIWAAIAVCSIFFYVACKKNISDIPKKIEADQVASIIALNFQKSLNGNYGGVNINDGIKAPHNMSVINSPNPLCGYTIDTTVNYSKSSGDTVSNIHGRFTFTYTCSGSTPDGYIASTSLLNIGSTPSFSFIYSIGQNYKVKALNPQYTLVSLDGTLKSYGDFKNTPKAFIDSNFAKSPNYQHQDYALVGLKINVGNNFDVISGTSTFISEGSNSYGTWSYTGIILFIGNHKAIITINNKQYNADLITGQVTPI